LAANALPQDATGVAQVTAELAVTLESFAPSADNVRALTFCNLHLLLDVVGVAHFLRRFAPDSPVGERFETTAAYALRRPWQPTTEVAAYYAFVFEAYRTALNCRDAASPFVGLAQDTFGRAFWAVRPRSASDRTDFRYAVYAQRLSGEPLRADVAAAYGVELIETIRAGDGVAAAWLLVAWSGANPLERGILPSALRLIDAHPPEPRLATLVKANVYARF
jgi:hypothetical protein